LREEMGIVKQLSGCSSQRANDLGRSPGLYFHDYASAFAPNQKVEWLKPPNSVALSFQPLGDLVDQSVMTAMGLESLIKEQVDPGPLTPGEAFPLSNEQHLSRAGINLGVRLAESRFYQ
jgi:hypothetical protein